MLVFMFHGAYPGFVVSMSREVRGFVDDIRDLGGIKFIRLNTDSGYVQVTIKKGEVSPELLAVSDKLTRQSCIIVRGMEQDNLHVHTGKELIPSKIELVTLSDVPLPLDPSGKTPAELDTRFDWRSLDLRTPKSRAVFKVEGKLIEGMFRHLTKSGFMPVFTPSLMGAPSESGSELFSVAYYEKEAFLRQDPQLHRELAVLGGLERVFEIGPSWRAELSHTTRHLSEHRTCAVELSYIKSEKDTMRVEEKMIRSAFAFVKKSCEHELQLLDANIDLPKSPFPVINFPDVYEILEQNGKTVKYGEDYDKESEQILAKYVKEKYGSDFFFVNRFPFAAKPFYVMKFPKDPEWARSVDLVYKGTEISSGGQREHRYETLLAQINEKGMNPSNLDWFTKFFKYGSPTLGGFSVGLERVVMLMLGIKNIKEAVLFSRDQERLLP